MSTLRYSTVEMTPRRAAELLDLRQPHARKIAAAVRDYAQAMRDGQWILNGMPLILSERGVLLDGVQRLLACIKAETPFRTVLAEGVRDDVVHTIDQQRRRGFAHVLEARGIAHAHAVHAALLRLIEYENGNQASAHASWSLLDRLLDANPDLIEAVQYSLEVAGPAVPEPVRSPLIFMGRRANPAATERFLNAVADPGSYPETEPGRVVRAELDRLRDIKASRPHRNAIFGLAIEGLNATMANRTLVDPSRWSALAQVGLLPRLLGYEHMTLPSGRPVTGVMALPTSLSAAAAAAAADQLGGVAIAVEVVDRDKAELLLRGNTTNRRVLPSHVDSIARDIRAGRWMLNAQPICVAADGTLLNGQHRLLAIISSGIAIEVPIARGLPNEALGTYDRHAKRGLEFGAALDSFGDRALAAAMANLLWRRELRPPGRRQTKATASEIQAIIQNHPRLLDLRRFARRMVDYGRSSVLGYGAYFIERDNKELAKVFLRNLETGAELPQGHPVLDLRRTLQRLRRAGASQDEQLDALMEGWSRFKSRYLP